MTQEIVEKPIPSMVNYPESEGLYGISEIGFDQKGMRYKINDSFNYATGSGPTERAYDLSEGQDVYWEDFNSNTDYINKTSDYKIKLQKKVSYKLYGTVAALEAPTGSSYIYREFRWYDHTNGYFGEKGGLSGGHNTTSTDSYMGMGSGPAIAYITPEEDTEVSLRITYAEGDIDYQTAGTTFHIEVINLIKK